MAGSTFLVGEQKVRPGVYVRTTNYGEPAAVTPPQGTVAVLFKASWGPLNKVEEIDGGVAQIDATYVSGGTIAAAEEVFRGNALKVLACRIGTSGVAATINLNDGASGSPVDIVQVDAKYVGLVGNDLKVTVRTNLTDATQRDFIVYHGTELVEQFTYTPGSDEAAALVAAAAGSVWVTTTKLAPGDGGLADVTKTALTGGTDPTTTGTEYSAGLTAIESYDFNVLVTDSEDTAIHASIQTFVDRVRGDGKRIIGVVGEPTSVALATRYADAKGFNDAAIVYVANGFKDASGNSLQGYKAAARVAGMIAAAAITDSLTHAVVTGAVDLVGALSNSDIITAINSGAIVFTFNAKKQVQIEYGINTLVTPAVNQDAGWKKIRRVKTRDYLMDSIAETWDPLIAKVNNNPDGRATLIAAAQGIINTMIAEGALLDGKITEDSANPPSGDSAWFVVQVDDVDSAEKLYLTFGFRFSAA